MVGDQVFQSTHPSGVRLDPCAHQMPQRGISIHAPQWGATFSIGTDTAASYFNPRTPVGCDHPAVPRSPWPSHFNPRTPVGCDVAVIAVIALLVIFQSTHPSGVRPAAAVLAWFGGAISIHAPQWGATSSASHSSRLIRYFNPRTPVGCDNIKRRLDLGGTISIHAPQWGATCGYRGAGQQVHISIHAPQWGATIVFRHQIVKITISIHAPQWGATFPSACLRLFHVFQSTHPSGVRLSTISELTSHSYFNPRTPVGCDFQTSWPKTWRTYFNPRTPVGCDCPLMVAAALSTYFNPRTPVGCDSRANYKRQ